MKRIGNVLALVFNNGEKIKKDTDDSYAFLSCWKDITEKNGIPAASAHSWIKSADKGLVWIEVDHPGWKHILQTKERKLLYDFCYRFPKMGISGISIVLCRPKNLIENIKSESIASEVTVKKEEQMPVELIDKTSFIQDEKIQNYEYDGIKSEALKKILMQLEKSIAEKEQIGA